MVYRRAPEALETQLQADKGRIIELDTQHKCKNNRFPIFQRFSNCSSRFKAALKAAFDFCVSFQFILFSFQTFRELAQFVFPMSLSSQTVPVRHLLQPQTSHCNLE